MPNFILGTSAADWAHSKRPQDWQRPAGPPRSTMPAILPEPEHTRTRRAGSFLSPSHPSHRPLHEPRKVFIDLHRHIHSPRHNHFSLLLQVYPQRSPRHTLSGDPAHRSRTHALQLISVNSILTKRRPHISRTNREHMNPLFLQLHARRLAQCIERKLGRAVS